MTLSLEDGSGAHARQRLRHLLDFTSVELFPRARDNNAVISVAATDDRYVPRHSTQALHAHWSNAEFRWLRGGHVSTILSRKDAFRNAVVDAIARLRPA